MTKLSLPRALGPTAPSILPLVLSRVALALTARTKRIHVVSQTRGQPRLPTLPHSRKPIEIPDCFAVARRFTAESAASPSKLVDGQSEGGNCDDKSKSWTEKRRKNFHKLFKSRPTAKNPARPSAALPRCSTLFRWTIFLFPCLPAPSPHSSTPLPSNRHRGRFVSSSSGQRGGLRT